jgi:alpha-glucosidase
MLELYRSALGIRRLHPALGDGSMDWLDAPKGVLAFARDPGFVCLVNLASDPVPAPSGALLLTSTDLTDDGQVPPDTTVWFGC